MLSTFKPTLILIHGWGCDSGIWSKLVPFLSAHFDTCLMDLPGYGDSLFSEKFWNKKHWLEEFAQALPNHALLCGWSLGGMIAMQLAAHFPKKVRRLITISATPKFSAGEDWSSGVSKKKLVEMQAALKDNPQKLLKQFQGWVSKGDKDIKKVLTALRETMIIENTSVYHQVLLASLDYLVHLDIRNEAARIQQPWLAIQGKNDVLVSSNSLVGYTNLEFAEVSEAGHAPMICHAELLSRHILNFSHKESENEHR